MSNLKCCLSVGTDHDSEDDAGDGSDNMLEGDIREKKGAATRCATSVTIFSNWSCP